MNKLIVVALVGLLLVGCIFILNNYKEEHMEKETKLFQGPVPLCYDLEHFRKTGETILEVGK